MTYASDHDGHVPSNTLDGSLDPESRWSAQGTPWIRYDLSRTVTLDGARIAFFNGAERIFYFAIEVSLDGENWTEVYTGGSSGSTLELEDFAFDSPREAASVRIRGAGNNNSTWNSYVEVQFLQGEDVLVGHGHSTLVDCLVDEHCTAGRLCDMETRSCPGGGIGSEGFTAEDFDILLETNFQDNVLGPYTTEQFRSNWGQRWRSLRSDNTTEVREVDGRRVLAHFYEQGEFGSRTGMNEWASLPRSGLEEVYYTFSFQFEEGFDFGLGGKFFGVGAGSVSTIASGGSGPDIGDRGGLARLMWNAAGQFFYYVYDHNMTSRYGRNMGVSPFGQIVPGQWQTMTCRFVLNSNGSRNGIMQVWLDGVLIATTSEIEYRIPTSPQELREFAIGSFMGGNSAQFAPSRSQYMWTDNFTIWTYDESSLDDRPEIPRGFELWGVDQTLVTPHDL